MRLTHAHFSWVLIALLVGSTVQAGPISGSISFEGEVLIPEANLFNAKTLYFEGPGSVTSASGDFLDYANPDTAADPIPVIFTDSLVFRAADGSALEEPVLDNPLWSAAGFEFQLTTLTVSDPSTSILIVGGTGFLSGNGFDDTAADWSLTITGSGQYIFGFDSSTASLGGAASAGAGAIPEPTTIGLLGLSGAFLGLRQRRRRARKI